MDPEDIGPMEEVRRDLYAVADLVESNFSANTSFKILNSYARVFTAATRTKVTDTEKQYAAAEQLYLMYQEYLTLAVERHSEETDRMTRDEVYKYAIRRWQNFKLVKKWMNKTFQYLSRYFIEHCNKRSLEFVAMSIFCNRVFKRVAPVLRIAILGVIDRERRGEDIDKEQLRLAVELVMSMGFEDQGRLPNQEFVEPLLLHTAEYYKIEAAQAIAEVHPMEFLRKAEGWLLAETARAGRLLPGDLHRPFVGVVEKEVLEQHESTILNHSSGGLVALLRNQLDDDLRLVFRLFSRLKSGLEPIALILKSYCQSEGVAIAHGLGGPVQGDPDFKAYCRSFLALHERYTALLANAFNNNTVCFNAVRDAFEASINAGLVVQQAPPPGAASSGPPAPGVKISAAELLSNYVDHLMKAGSSGEATSSEEEVEQTLTNLVSLIARLSDKDIFHEFMRRLLSRRLLAAAGGFNEDLERSLIAKLKAKFGASSTSRLDSMIGDRNTSLELTEAMKRHVGEHPELPQFDFTIQVLTSGVWPQFSPDTAIVPPPVRTLQMAFQTVYERGKSQRVLTWMNSLGSAVLAGTYSKGKEYSLHMTLFQAVVLLMFDTGTRVTLGEIQARTGLDWDEVKRTAQSFCHSRVRLLNRVGGEGTAMKEGDVLSINEEFTSQIKKIKVPVAVQRMQTAQSAAVTSAVVDDRKPAIDACIVRVMKSRRQEEHTLLVAEVINQLSIRFQPDPRLIKARIEELINRDYLERHPSAPSTYVYVA